MAVVVAIVGSFEHFQVLLQLRGLVVQVVCVGGNVFQLTVHLSQVLWNLLVFVAQVAAVVLDPRFVDPLNVLVFEEDLGALDGRKLFLWLGFDLDLLFIYTIHPLFLGPPGDVLLV